MQEAFSIRPHVPDTFHTLMLDLSQTDININIHQY